MVTMSVSSRCLRLLLAGSFLALALLLALSVTGCGTATTTDSSAPDNSASGDDGAVADGTHFGYVVEIGEDYMLVDLAELFSNEEAQEAALADGEIDSLDELPNPFYVRNPDETPVHLDVDPGAEFLLIAYDEGGTPVLEKNVTMSELASLAAGESDGIQYYGGLPGQPGPTGLPMDLTISDGQVTGGSQVYLP